MSKVKEAQMAKEELLDNIQKFVLCGRAMLDAVEQAAQLFAECAMFKEKCEIEHTDTVPAEPALAKQAEEKTEATKTATLEEVRGRLAEKSRSGFRAEVKALLSAHGVEKLSEITDPAELGTLLSEAEKIGAADG